MNAEQPKDEGAEENEAPRIFDHWRRSPGAAFVTPLVVFLMLLQIALWLRVENPAVAWWRSTPELWIYPIQTIACLALLAFWRRHYPFRPIPSGAALVWAIAAGVGGIAIWLTPVAWHAATGLGGEDHWLRWLGFRDRLEGFDPTRLDRHANPVLWFLTVAFRFVRLVVVVPLVEEIFWRGFLMRWLIDSGKPWHRIPIGTFGWKSFLITAVLFALIHQPADRFVAFLYGALAGWLTIRTRSLAAVILMHAVANLILGFYILKTGFWGLW